MKGNVIKMKIDAHAHIFPQKIASKASVNIGKFYDLHMEYDGTVESLLDAEAKAGVDMAVVQSVATVPEQVETINTFISQEVGLHPDKLIGFATLHPDFENIADEVERVISLGLKGIKIHPDFQKFCIDDKKAYRIYEAVEGRLPVLVHTGDFRFDYSKPRRMAKVLSDFPKLDVIAAHFGGWSEWDEAQEMLGGKRVWVDSSSSLYALPKERVKELIRSFGIDRVFFGTDYPMWNITDEVARVEALGLTEEELEMLYHGNIERMLFN